MPAIYSGGFQDWLSQNRPQGNETLPALRPRNQGYVSPLMGGLRPDLQSGARGPSMVGSRNFTPQSPGSRSGNHFEGIFNPGLISRDEWVDPMPKTVLDSGYRGPNFWTNQPEKAAYDARMGPLPGKYGSSTGPVNPGAGPSIGRPGGNSIGDYNRFGPVFEGSLPGPAPDDPGLMRPPGLPVAPGGNAQPGNQILPYSRRNPGLAQALGQNFRSRRIF